MTSEKVPDVLPSEYYPSPLLLQLFDANYSTYYVIAKLNKTEHPTFNNFILLVTQYKEHKRSNCGVK